MSFAHVDFLGEIYPVTSEVPVVIGREGDVAIDDNPYLHRRFLEISVRDSLVWISNIGSTLSATLSDGEGLLQAWLAPGAQLPMVFHRAAVWFTAGPTTYDLDIVLTAAPFSAPSFEADNGGSTTIGRLGFTLDQQLLILVLAEDLLRRGNRGAGSVPSSADAALKLGWTITKFNRKLDNVCDKLTRHGVRGLHGDAGKLATSRRARLVEYALSARIVTPPDLILLEGQPTS